MRVFHNGLFFSKILIKGVRFQVVLSDCQESGDSFSPEYNYFLFHILRSIKALTADRELSDQPDS